MNTDMNIVMDVIPSISTSVSKPKKKNKKGRKHRCSFSGCKKKLSFMDMQMTCKCNHNFCSSHRPLGHHNCSADHVALNQAYLIKNNPIVIPSKLNMV